MESSNPTQADLLWCVEPHTFGNLVASRQARYGASSPRRNAVHNTAGVAIIPVEGMLSKSGDAFNGTAYPVIQEAVERAAADPNIDSIMLAIDSPGGSASGVLEVGNAIFAARAAKPIVAQISGLCASAAYWLASQCHSIVAGPLSLVGSIGVRMLLLDVSVAFKGAGVRPVHITSGPFKGVGAAGPAVTEQQEAYLQGLVDHTAGAFIEAVAQGRGVPPATVKSWADGRVHPGTSAKQLGLIDDIGTETETLAKLAAIEPARQRQKFDARAEFERCVANRVAGGERPDRARAAVVRECPDLHQMMLAQANATRPKVLERLAR